MVNISKLQTNITSMSSINGLDSECNFVPHGHTLDNCIHNCYSDFSDLWQISGGCNQQKCSNICNNCSDKERCKWLNAVDLTVFKERKPSNHCT